uniref:Uncharacterized protein n=1 Tax=Ciona savignyi TaxID=51511 RepID=H2ZQ74_CIOSA
MERVIVSPSRAKWYKLPLGGASKKKSREDFVNPVFIERPVCHDLTLQTSPMNGNAYVTTPKQSPNLGHKTVEESTVDYKACDLANGLEEETPYEVIKPLNPQLEDYAFALDTTPKTPILQKSKKAAKVTKPKGNISQDGFDEIWSKPLPTPSED